MLPLNDAATLVLLV